MNEKPFPKLTAVLGSTGSVGTQALEVIEKQGIAVDFLTAKSNVALAESQVRRFSPRIMIMTDEDAAKDLRVRVKDTKTRILSSTEAILQTVSESKADVVIHSILGEAGLSPLAACIESGKTVGLANKESLVIGGDILLSRAEEKRARIIPVDSEHSAIFQCLDGRDKKEIRSILLTASGGPFYGCTKEKLRTVTKAQALAHPTWKMGDKITVDSATLMNKGFEVIEAVRLFGVKPEQIRVLIHRESIIHSAVEYIDNAVIAQMSVPDMRLCVQYALSYPKRACGLTSPLSLTQIGALTFREADTEAFPLLALAYKAISLGGGVPAVLNAANEVAVDAFLKEQIGFTDIFEIVERTLLEMESAKDAFSLSLRLACSKEARRRAGELIVRK